MKHIATALSFTARTTFEAVVAALALLGLATLVCFWLVSKGVDEHDLSRFVNDQSQAFENLFD